MEYKEITLFIKSTTGESFESFMTSPAGESQPKRIDDTLLESAQQLQHTLRDAVRARQDADATKTARGIGKALSRAVFKGEAGALLKKSLAKIEGRHDRGLRVKLHTFTSDTEELLPILWELLPYPGRDAFLSQSEQTPIVRHLHLPLSTEPQPFEPPLRILVALSNPTNTPALDLETERRAIEESVASQRGVEVTFIPEAPGEPATLGKVLKELAQTPYHVFHFMGHGGAGELVFEDEERRAHRVTGQQLAEEIKRIRQKNASLSLIFLNACKSGTTLSRTAARAETPEPGTREDTPVVGEAAERQAEAPPPPPSLTQPLEVLPLIQPAVWGAVPRWTQTRPAIPKTPATPSSTPDAPKAARPAQRLPWGTTTPWAPGGAETPEPAQEATGDVMGLLWAHAAPWGRFAAHLIPWSQTIPWARSIPWAHTVPWGRPDLEEETATTGQVRGDGATQEAEPDEPFDPFAGVALALMNAEILAVVAMQFSISDTAAKAFAGEFYKRLMLGTPVDVAVNVGRIAIDTAQKKDDAARIKPMEWMTPVLYMRAPDGMLFKQKKSSILAENDDLQILLRKVRRAWIEHVLTPSVFDGEPINLGMEEVPETVNRSRPASSPKRQTSLDERVGAVAAEGFDGSLLILGAPGSGKTTTLLALTRALLPRAEAFLTEPIPVVFNLATWTGTSLRAWLVDELGAKYQIPAPTAEAWLQARKLLPLLDGLDAAEAGRRATCVTAINAYMKETGHPGIVVTCRLEAYTALMKAGHRLAFADAVRLQPLTQTQIDAYLARAGTPLTGLRNALRTDEALRRRAQSPATLDVLTRTYVEEKQPVDASTDPLLDTYVDRMFVRQQDPDPPYTRAQMTAWLQWLARRMTTHHQNIFLIERMQPTWLSSAWRRGANLLLFSIVLGLIFGTLAMLGWMMSEGLDPSVDPEICTDRDWRTPFTVKPLFSFWLWWLSCSVWMLAAGALGWMKLPWMQQSISDSRRRHWRTQILRILTFFGLWVLVWEQILVVMAFLGQPIPSVSHPAIFGAILVILYAIRVDTIHYIRTVEALGWSLKHAWPGMLWGALCGLGVWVIYVAANWVGFPWGAPWATMSHLAFNLMLYPPLAAAGGFLIGGIRIRIDARKTAPNQGVRLSLLNAYKGALTGPVVGLVSFFVFPLALACGKFDTLSLVGAGFVTVITAAIGFLWYGGLDVLKHLVLRITLRGTEQKPAHFARFLDYAARLNLLKKAGGGYLFANRALQAHFAAMEEVKSE